MIRRAALLLALLAGLAGLAGAPAQARAAAPAVSADTGIPMFPATGTRPPAGFAITPAQAAAIAKTSPTALAIHRVKHPLHYQVYVWSGSHYEVYFSYRGALVADVIVTARGGLGPTYTGAKMLGVYARSGYGRLFDSPWVLVPFTLMFLAPLALLRRRSWLDVADIGAVLSLGVSYAFFDHGHVDLGVWLVYPPLLYLMTRMLLRGFRPRAGGRLDVRLPTAVLVGGLLLLIAGRIAVTLLPASVMDVGEASVIGAARILHGQPVYFPSLGHPDTYGPINYLAYVPFQAIWPSTQWAYVPAARAATISFDLLTIGALLLAGRRLRPGRDGRRLGLLLAWLWAACPATVLGLIKNTNDGFIALLLVVSILALTTPVRRGIALGLATAAKFFPAILLPLIAVGHGGGDRNAVRKTLAAFVVVCGVSVAVFLPPGGLREMWDHTLGFQLSRTDIFSPWALHPGLAPIKVAIEAAVALLALLVAFRPRGARTTAQVSALAAALVIGVQLPALHWFYFYVVWFVPLVLIAVAGAGAELAGPVSAASEHDAKADAVPAADPARALIGAA